MEEKKPTEMIPKIGTSMGVMSSRGWGSWSTDLQNSPGSPLFPFVPLTCRLVMPCRESKGIARIVDLSKSSDRNTPGQHIAIDGAINRLPLKRKRKGERSWEYSER